MLSLRSNHRPSLFWRTFILLCGLIFFSVVGWLQSFRVLSELPYSQGVAQHIVSTANLTKYALVTADPLFRVDLLKLLAAREGLLLSPRDATDKVVVLSGDGFNGLIEQLVKHQLGQDTILASSVNGVSGLWVSVDIDGDAYWMRDRQRHPQSAARHRLALVGARCLSCQPLRRHAPHPARDRSACQALAGGRAARSGQGPRSSS
ncbi:MAG: hypothetical protein ACLR8J_07225 [Sutterella wadsworthensis]